jgi:hypothetical protein
VGRKDGKALSDEVVGSIWTRELRDIGVGKLVTSSRWVSPVLSIKPEKTERR